MTWVFLIISWSCSSPSFIRLKCLSGNDITGHGLGLPCACPWRKWSFQNNTILPHSRLRCYSNLPRPLGKPVKLVWKVHSLKRQDLCSLPRKWMRWIFFSLKILFLRVLFPNCSLKWMKEKSPFIPLNCAYSYSNCCLRWTKINFWKVFEVPTVKLFSLSYSVWLLWQLYEGLCLCLMNNCQHGIRH